MRNTPGRVLTRGARGRSWWLVFVAVCAAVASAVVGLTGAPVWLQAVVLALGATVGVLVVEWRAWWEHRDAFDAVVRSLVLGATKEPPLVGAVLPEDVDVRPSRRDVPYLPRAVEEPVADSLRDRGRVLIVGAAMSGKTRLALQVARELYGDRTMLRPRPPNALHELWSLEVGDRYDPLLIWLDNLDEYLVSEGLNADDLKAFHSKGSVVIGTIRAAAYETLRKSGARATGREVLDWLSPTVHLRWHNEELASAQQPLPEEVLDGARQYGLPVYLGGGPNAKEEFRTAETTRPVGHALVRAAADWRRAGVTTPVPGDTLRSLVPYYLDSPPAASDLDAGLRWATTSLDDTVSLLSPAGDGFDVLDYIVDVVAADHPAIPDRVWDVIAEQAPIETLVNVGVTAATVYNLTDKAAAVWQRSTDPIAQYNLGLAAYRGGSPAEAARRWRTAADAGDPAAMYSLSVLLQRAADPDSVAQAEHWSRRAAAATKRTSFPRLTEPAAIDNEEIEFSGATTPRLREELTETVRGYRRYLASIGTPLGPVPTLHVEEGAQTAYPDPPKGRLLLGSSAADYPGVVLHEYTHWVMEDLVAIPRVTWTADAQAIEAGLAYYLPSSHFNDSRTGFVDLQQGTALSIDMLDQTHRDGLRWATTMWELRQRTGQDTIDRALVSAWQQTDATHDDSGIFTERLAAAGVST